MQILLLSSSPIALVVVGAPDEAHLLINQPRYSVAISFIWILACYLRGACSWSFLGGGGGMASA